MMSRPNPTPKVKGGKRGLGAAILLIISAVFALEGGYVNHPHDPGGATNYGITERVARDHGYRGDMRELKRTCEYDDEICAESIYAESYIAKPGFLPLVRIDPTVAEEVIDTAVNMGPRRPSRYFQRAVNRVCGTRLAVDGRVGAMTVKAWADCRKALGWRSCISMLSQLDAQQEAEYRRLAARSSKMRSFLRGWLNHRIGNVDRARCGEQVAS